MADDAPAWAKDTPDTPVWAQDTKEAQPSEWTLPNLGRQVALAARAPVEAANHLVNMVPDAATSLYNAATNPPKNWADVHINPFDARSWPSNAPSAQISALMTKYGVPEPQGAHWYSPERLSSTVESLLSGSRMPVPGAMTAPRPMETPGALVNAPPVTNPEVPGALATFSPETRAAAQMAASKSGQAALAKIQQAMQRDGLTFEQATQKVSAANQAGVPLTLADVGPNTTTTAEVLAQRPGEAQTTILDNRLGTLQDTKTRVPAATRDALDANVGDPGRFEAGLSKLRADNARENYAAVRADATPVTDPAIWHLLENPTIGKLFGHARELHDAENGLANTLGKPLPPLADIYAPANPADLKAVVPQGQAGAAPQWVRTGTAPDVRTLDYLQRAMDDQVGTLYRNGQGQLASLLSQARKQLVGRLQQISPEFAKAFKTYAGDSEMIEAHDFGNTGFMNLSPGAAADYIKGLSDSGRNALRAGAAESLLAAGEKTGRNVNMASNILGGPRRVATLRTLFDNDTDFNAFKSAMDAENKMFQNTQQITRGSQTFRRAAASEDFDQPAISPGIMETLRSGWHLAHGNVVMPLLSMMAKRSTWNPEVASKAAKILTSSDPARSAQEIQLLSRMTPESQQFPGALRGTVATSISHAPPAQLPQQAQKQEEDDRKPTLADLLARYPQ